MDKKEINLSSNVLGIGDWPIPNPQSPIPNPQLLIFPYTNLILFLIK